MDFTPPVDLSVLAPVPREPADADSLRADLVAHIEAAAGGSERSRQRKIGPSEIGHPCDRRLGYRSLGVDKINDRPGWRPTVGTAVHEWLAHAMLSANKTWRETSGVDTPRYLVESKVEVGDEITGSCDLYDRVTATLVDWKVVATSTIRDAKANGPSEQYRIQAHLYGRGWTRRGLDVEAVGIFFLPSSGELHEGHLWTEPYDEQVALDALDRLRRTTALTATFGAKALPVLSTDGAIPRLCRYCPWFLPAATDPTEACPGAVAKRPSATAVA